MERIRRLLRWKGVSRPGIQLRSIERSLPGSGRESNLTAVNPSAGESSIGPIRDAAFQTTHWSVVLAAARSESPDAAEALENLCTAYWYPLFAYLRRKGHPPHEAEDLTQQFFAARVVTRAIFCGAAPEHGKFRTWLLNSLQNLVLNEFDRGKAQKRGGGFAHVPLDFPSAEARYSNEPACDLTPECAYERAWALALIDRALSQLREKYERAGKIAFFEELKCYLPGALSGMPHAEVAARLGKSEDSVKMAVSRLRREYGQTLRTQIKRTVSTDVEVGEELRHLFVVLGG